MQQPGEPSVEEILESIKKVIARDSAMPLSPPRRRMGGEPVDPAGPDEAAEVLELDEIAMDRPATGPDHGVERMAGSDLDAGDFPDPATANPAGDDSNAPLTGMATASAMRDNFAALAMLSRPGRAPQIVRSGETSLEGLTRELLRPMLAKWLDDHLPAMVEELVKAEIARIAGKKP